MKRCPKCGRTHEDTVISCDCGHDFKSGSWIQRKKGASMSTDSTTNNQELKSKKNNSPIHKVVGILLLLGTFIGQCAGGKVPDNPSIITSLTFWLGLTGAILVFNGVARIAVIVLVISSFILTLTTVIAGPNHWYIGGIWIFDILALSFLILAFFIALRTNKAEET